MANEFDALCIEVWTMVPTARPDSCLIVDGSPCWPETFTEKDKINNIQAPCMRWLLDNKAQFDRIDPPDLAATITFFMIYASDYNKWDEMETLWAVQHEDFTTVLLLAIKRCYEYNNPKDLVK